MMADMNFAALSVEIGIAVLMAAVLLLDLILEKNAPRRILGGVTAVGLLAVLAGAVGMYPPDGGAVAFYAGRIASVVCAERDVFPRRQIRKNTAAFRHL